jgi:hypothetical protein
LAFVVFENISHTSLVPALGKSISSFHFRFFFMRRPNATSGLPLNSYVIEPNLHGPRIGVAPILCKFNQARPAPCELRRALPTHRSLVESLS